MALGAKSGLNKARFGAGMASGEWLSGVVKKTSKKRFGLVDRFGWRGLYTPHNEGGGAAGDSGLRP